ncbi:MAG: hypothetical protein JWR67_805 [Mucilaginibacter sp.]|nr:hypothetical protein [Mucilaginibacter sp.]
MDGFYKELLSYNLKFLFLKMENDLLITTEKDYQEIMIAIFELMEKGEDYLTTEEVKQLKRMTAAAEKYENEYL